jgi:DNA-binding CsgD family transcriptional regulator/tetratricopeptide (TPR) repeat protein
VGLLERDTELDVLRRAARDAASGSGAGVVLSGEPGAGKSVLVETAYREMHGCRLLRGVCDPLSTPRPLGPFRDLSRVSGIKPLLGGTDVSLAQACDTVYDALRADPTVLVVEDLHWVDGASAEVLRFLARRLDSLPLALVLTYRDAEITAQHSARPLLGDIASMERLTSLRLAPLSVAAVGVLLEGTGLRPAEVHALTGGNPFYVTEVAKDPDRPLPASVRDAVLSRTADVQQDDFEVLQLAATAPDRLDDRVLPALGVDLPTLRRLHGTGLLLRDRGGLVFRHELARIAVESTIPAGGAAPLHARLLDALEAIEPRDLAVLTHHAVAARDGRRAAHYARAAAEDAMRTGSHTEAVSFLRTALRHLDDSRSGERAALLTKLGWAEYMTNRLGSAIGTIRSSFPLWQSAGDAAGLSAAHQACAVLEYYNVRSRQAEAHIERATDLARDEFPVGYGMALATRGYLAFQRSDYAATMRCVEEASRIAEDEENEALALRGAFLGAASALAVEDEGARDRLLDIVDPAVSLGLYELTSTCYSNLVNLDVEQRRLRAADHCLEDSLPLTVEHDIPICHYWQTGVRSRLRLLQGRWSAGLEDAEYVLTGSGMPLARLWPHVVSGLLGLRRTSDDGGHLDAAWELADELDEPLRRLPVLSALAERMWLTGRADEHVTDTAVRAVDRLAGAPGSLWAVGDLAVWLCRLGLLTTPPVDVAVPFHRALTGRHEESAAWWHRAGAVFDEAMARVDSAEPEEQSRGVQLLDLLGATATADRVRLDMRRAGVLQLPHRPRTATLANPAGLTNRQLDVAKLVARGLTNAEIADRLYISPKTADHHVSAVLTKLGVPSRRAVIAQADDMGLA